MYHILTLTEDDWQEISSLFSNHGGREHLYSGLLTINETSERREFFLKEALCPQENDYMEQSASVLKVRPDFMAELLLKSKQYAGVLLFHNHLGFATPSSIDNKHIQKTIQNVNDFRNESFVIRGIWGKDGFFAEVKNAQMEEWASIDFVKIIGDESPDSRDAASALRNPASRERRGMRLYYPLNAQKRKDCEEIDEERHNRTLNFLGERGEETLKLISALKWGFIGAGGTMSCFIYMIKFLTPKSCVIVEGDKIERSNANRLFGYRHGDDGVYKGDVMRRELLSFDPKMEVEVVNDFFPNDLTIAALKDCDILICGPDNDFCRYHAAEFASRYWKVLLDFGSGIRLDKKTGLPAKVGSQARLQLPTKNGKCLACLGLETEDLINPKIKDDIIKSSLQIGYIQDSDLPTPVSVVTINAIIAAVGVRLLLSYISGIGKTPSYLIYDELELQFRDVSNVFKKRQDCPLCGRGENSFFGWGDNIPERLKMIEPYEEGKR